MVLLADACVDLLVDLRLVGPLVKSFDEAGSQCQTPAVFFEEDDPVNVTERWDDLR